MPRRKSSTPMYDDTVRRQKDTGVYNTPLGWAAREAVRQVEEDIKRDKKTKARKGAKRR